MEPKEPEDTKELDKSTSEYQGSMPKQEIYSPAGIVGRSRAPTTMAVKLDLSVAGEDSNHWDQEQFLSGYAELLGVPRRCVSMTNVCAPLLGAEELSVSGR